MFDSHASAKRTLKNTLRANAGFSLLSGVLMLAFGGEIAEVLGSVDVTLIRVLGGGVAAFGLAVGWMSMRPAVRERDARLVSSLDWAWVAGSAIVLLAYPAVFSPLGWWLVFGVAIVVADFAIIQLLAVRGMRRSGQARLA